MFVTVSGVVTGVGALILALVPDLARARSPARWSSGSATGCTSPSTSRCAPRCCPPPQARAKDLGVINIAVALPQVFAPFVGSFLVAYAGGYVTLYAVAFGVCVLGSVLVHRIRGVA